MTTEQKVQYENQGYFHISGLLDKGLLGRVKQAVGFNSSQIAGVSGLLPSMLLLRGVGQRWGWPTSNLGAPLPAIGLSRPNSLREILRRLPPPRP